MIETTGGESELLVVATNQSSGTAVVESIEATDTPVGAEYVAPADALAEPTTDDVAGAVVDGQVADVVSVVDRLTDDRGLPVVVLVAPTADSDTVAGVLEAGARDVFPRTSATAQYELVVERLLADDPPGEDTTVSGQGETYGGEFERIFDEVSDTIAVFHPTTGEILNVNETYHELWGYDDLETIQELGIDGLSVTEEGYTAERGIELIRDVAATGETEVVEWLGETRDGERRWTEAKLTAAEIGGERRVLSIQRDVTERKRREQRLEVFNRILRHNLRNHVDVIRSHAEVLADRTTDGHAERILGEVNEIARIGARVRETDRMMSADDTPTRVDLSETARERTAAVRSTRSDVTVTTDLPETAPVWTNEKAVSVAVENALENAVEHAETLVTVSVEDSDDGYVVEVEDDGPGIPDEELAPIEARRETDLQHGTGLGLWQLRWSVDKLNGALSFDTTGGTTVRVTVPDRRGASHAG